MIEIKKANVGKLHSDLGIKQGEKIPTSRIISAEKTAGPAEMKRLNFAKNARGWSHKGRSRGR